MHETMQLRLTIQRETTFGRGDGLPGLIDAEVEHDFKTGLPFLHGRTLKGLLVEACANVLYALDAANAKGLDRLQGAAHFLFGRPGSTLDDDAQMQIGSARLSRLLREAIAHDVACGRLAPDAVLDTLTTLRRQTAINETTGAPDEGSLRTARVLRRDLTFYAPLIFVQEPDPDALALLAACARGVQRAGTTRTRGRGRLRVSLYDGASNLTLERREAAAEQLTQQHLKHFRDCVSSDAKRPKAPSQQAYDLPDKHTVESTTFRVRLRLEQPVLAVSVDGDPNSAVSYDFLPGSALRGALVARFLQRYPESRTTLATAPRTRSLFFDGSTRFLNAYPLAQDSYGDLHATQPVPLSWHVPKGIAQEIRDFALQDPDETEDEQWKRPGKPFVAQPTDQPLLQEAEHRVAVHHRRNRVAGRPLGEARRDLGDPGAIFRYDALAPAQMFEAMICCDRTEDADVLATLLRREDGKPISLCLGGARSAGYGLVQVVEDVERRSGPRHFQSDPMPNSEGLLVLVLESDALVRDEIGQHTTNPAVLVAAINRRLELDGAQRLTLDRAFVQGEVVGGFNRKWGLPMSQVLAARRGSVLVLRVPDERPDDFTARLKRLEAKGFGERRAEGFGQVRFLRDVFDPNTTIEIDQEEPETEHEPRATEDDPEAHKIAQHIVQRLLRRHLDLHLTQQVGLLKKKVLTPSRSQLARIRSAFRSALEYPPAQVDEGRQRLKDFLNALPANAREQLSRDRIGQDRSTLLCWLKQRASDKHTDVAHANIWTLLDTNLLRNLSTFQVGEAAQARLTDTLAYEYNLRLVCETLHRAARAKKN